MTFPTKEFKIEMIRHDLTGAQIARHLRIFPQQLSMVICNQRNTEQIKLTLYALLNDMRAGRFKSLEDYPPVNR